MKVIDLLNRIANGEEVPKKIKYHNRIYIKRSDCYNYILKNGNFDDELKVIVGCLNDEIEIIEEDKKIEHYYFSVFQDERLGGRQVVESLENKINEIIKVINEMREDK